MQKNLRWKLLTIAVVMGLSIWSFTPPSQKVALGLDLKGGAHFVLEVHTDDAVRLETETTSEQLRVAANEAKIPVTSRVTGLDSFVIEGVPGPMDQQFRSLADQQTALSFTREASGMVARCIQHEIDHLDGILFVDHLSPLKRQLLLARYKKDHRGEDVIKPLKPATNGR